MLDAIAMHFVHHALPLLLPPEMPHALGQDV